MFKRIGQLASSFRAAASGFTTQKKMSALARSALANAVHGDADKVKEIVDCYFEQDGDRAGEDGVLLIRAAIRLDDPDLLDQITEQLGISKADFEFEEDVKPVRGEAYYTCIPLLSQAIILRAKAVTLALLDDPQVDAAKPIRMRNIDAVFTKTNGAMGDKLGTGAVTRPGEAEKELHTPDMLASGQYGWADVVEKINAKLAIAPVPSVVTTSSATPNVSGGPA